MTTVYNHTAYDFTIYNHTTGGKKTIHACEYGTVDNFANSTLNLATGPKVKTTNFVRDIMKIKTNDECLKLDKDNCKDGCVPKHGKCFIDENLASITNMDKKIQGKINCGQYKDQRSCTKDKYMAVGLPICKWDKNNKHFQYCSSEAPLKGKYCDVYCSLKSWNTCEWSIECQDKKHENNEMNSQGNVNGCTPSTPINTIFGFLGKALKGLAYTAM